MITNIKKLTGKAAAVVLRSEKPNSDSLADADGIDDLLSRYRNGDASSEPRFALNPWIETRSDERAGTRVLVDNQTGAITGCNDTAWVVLKCLKKGATRKQLVYALETTFDVASDQAGMDTDYFFKHLNTLGYIREID